MTVQMSKGNSGCRQDYKAPVPESGQAQPILKTETFPDPGGVQFPTEKNTQSESGHVRAHMPTGANHPVHSEPRKIG
jgi:hypothetical protein